jgi:formate-nitrite transporter family protein
MNSYSAPEVTAEDHIWGPDDAKVTVVEYGDYECPYCRGAARDVHRLLERYPGRIRFVFRNLPIAALHPHAQQAAEAAEAAAAQGKFWPMYELLLQPYSRLDTDSLTGYARQIGLDIERFHADLDAHTFARRIDHDIDTGLRNGVNSTPKFYVNGARIDGGLPLEGLAEAVDDAANDTTRPARPPNAQS